VSATLVGMISNDGAALIATLYPIALLLLGFESRALLRVIRPAGPRARQLLTLLLVIPLTLSVASTWICVLAVSSSETLDGFGAVVVAVTGVILAVEVSLAIGMSIASSITSDD